MLQRPASFEMVESILAQSSKVAVAVYRQDDIPGPADYLDPFKSRQVVAVSLESPDFFSADRVDRRPSGVCDPPTNECGGDCGT